jgi:hypothetical protein
MSNRPGNDDRITATNPTRDSSDSARQNGGAQVSSSSPRARSNRGFASMDREKQREIASKGGRAAHEKGTAHEFTADEARRAGKKGGVAVSRNKRHMAEIGRRGGERVSRDRDHMAQIGKKGGEAVSGDRAHMAQSGRKGGEARGDQR